MNDVIVAWISVAGSILVSLVSLAGVIYTGKKTGNEMSKQLLGNTTILPGVCRYWKNK